MSNFASNSNMTALFTAAGEKIGERAKIFPGTKAEWDALPLSEKIKYDYVAFAGDSQSGIVDDVPTEDSENLVKSGGVYDAINDVYVANGILGAKNLIPFNLDVIKAQNTGGTWSNNVFTFRDVSYTFNDDGSIVVNGTASSSNNSIITLTGYDLVLPKAGEYKLVCSEITDTGIDWMYLYDVTTSADLANSARPNFTYNGTDLLVFKYMVRSGQTVTNKTLHPMILVQNDTDSTYQPYAKTNQELTSQMQTLETSISTTNTAITNKHKLTRKTVNTSSWTADTTSQSGSTLYKKSIALSHVYVDSPSVDISTSSGSGLPTAAQQEAYDLLQYVTVDGTTMYLYASAIPSTTFYIGIEGVD